MRTGKRIAVLVAVGALLALAAGSGTAPSVRAAVQADDRPNVVVIMTDDQTADSLQYMANVQRYLVRQGVTFQNSFASFPLCCPSRATLLTGQYAHNHGVLGNEPPRGGYAALDHTNTLPVWLEQAGYHTAFVGKYMNGYGDGENRNEFPPGWSDWRALLKTPGTNFLAYRGFRLNENGEIVAYPKTEANYQTDVLTRTAVDAIQRGSSYGSPFFLWLAYFAPHSGYPIDDDDSSAPGITLNPSPALRHRDAFASTPLPRPLSFDEADVSDKPRSIRNIARLSIEQKQAIKEAYQQRLESLLAVDEGVAQIVEALRQARVLSNTMIVFTSDNGFMHGEHRIAPDRAKGWAYEASARVPLVVRGPNIPRGRRVTDLVSNVDLAPTFLSLAKATPGRVVDGRSLLPLARDPLADFGRDLLIESNHVTALRTNRYVFMGHDRRTWELYDLQKDPEQLDSRHADPALAKIRYELSRRLDSLGLCSGASCLEEPRLKVRLGPLNGRAIRVGLAGADATWVRRARFYVDGKPVANDRRKPFDVLLQSALVRPRATIRVQVRTTDGRGVTMTRKVPPR